MLGSIILDLDPIDEGRSTVGGLGPRLLTSYHALWFGYFLAVGSGGAHRLGSDVATAPTCLDSLRLPAMAEPFVNPVPRGMQIPYPFVVDLPEGYRVSQVRQLETADRLTAKVALMRGILEAQQKMLGPHSPDHETEAMPKNSLHGQTNTASHEIIGNFMTKMAELLEATLANRRGERAQNTSNDEALERFLRFRPPKFHGEVEQEAKAEMFLEQLNDIYDTLQYEGARRVTFATF
ncbi:hypothetical protein M9H77_14201 [Catharanthus roseus]|uniref:Uncharacterized protein n=1 Tax=Catharanthus roseus TaxID=4058 RepID=A0ACC0BMC5_CATRO|nr:hypothetical protein M9H77_14201 [Catharanthus roseus]